MCAGSKKKVKVKMKLHSYAAAMEGKFKTEETCARLQWRQPPGVYRVFFCEGGQGDRNAPQRCEFDMKHVVLYVGHLYKPFWTKKNRPGWQGGSGKVKIMDWCTWPIEMTQICHILSFPSPSCRSGRIFLVQNGLYRCPTYSTTCFMSNSHLWGVFLALWSQI